MLGGLFYGLSLKNQAASSASAPKATDLTNTKEPSANFKTALPAEETSPVLPPNGETAEHTELQGGADESRVEARPSETARKQEDSERRVGSKAFSDPKPSQDPAGLEPGKPALSQAPIGIRLAPDVRLPVAAMPLDFEISSVAKKVLDQIVEDYYREVALQSASQDQNGEADPAALSTTDFVEESETGELTRIITNGPVVDQARERADARFKALFGFEAYNRMTINTLLEAREPLLPEE